MYKAWAFDFVDLTCNIIYLLAKMIRCDIHPFETLSMNYLLNIISRLLT